MPQDNSTIDQKPQIPAPPQPLPIAPADLAKISGAGPNGGWPSPCRGPNGGWY